MVRTARASDKEDAHSASAAPIRLVVPLMTRPPFAAPPGCKLLAFEPGSDGSQRLLFEIGKVREGYEIAVPPRFFDRIAE
jgi:hypothetical protein